MSTDSSDGATLLRRALLRCGSERVLALVDQLTLQPSAGADILVVAPLRNLKKSRSLGTFAASAPLGAVRTLAELLSHDALERVVAILGEYANDPSWEQLRDAVDQLADEEVAPDVVAVMLAFAVANEVPAAEHCRRLLFERPEFALPELDGDHAAAPLLNPKAVDPAVREQRRQRREDQKSSRQRAKTHPPSRSTSRASLPATKGPPPRTDANAERTLDVAEFTRRRVALTPLESEAFSADHPLSGWVVELDVPYNEGQLDETGASSKTRPVVVVAGSDVSLLVRPVFSQNGPERTLLSGWNRLGLARPSYVAPVRQSLAYDATASPRRFGRLTDEEWNSLF